MALAYLYEPEIQYQTKDGRNNTNGFLRVYLAATDDPATTYSDFNGTLNQQDIRLDDDGRAVVIVDNSKAYRLEVYDPEGTLLFTCSPVTAVGGGGGSGTNFVQVISSDGTVSVSSSTSAGTRYFDLSVAIDDNKPSKWADRTGTATLITGDGEWHELGNWVDIGTTVYLNGWQMGTDAGYDVAGSLEMLSGDADALSSIDVRFLVTLDGVAQVEEFGRIDPTKDRDRVSFEWKQEGLDHQVVNARIFVRASEDMDVSLVSRACYNEEVDGIVGNDSGSYIAGDYIEITGNMIQATGLQPLSGMSAYAYESSLSSKLDASASSEFYPTSNPSGFVTGGPYVYESSYSSFSSEITDNISSISSIVSAISGQTGDFVEKSSISAESAQWNEVSGMSGKVDETAMSAYVPFSGLEHDNGGKITAISGSGLKGHEYTGVNPVWVDNTEDKVGVYHRTLAVDETMTAYDSGDSAVIGVNTAILSGYAQASSLDDYQLKSAMTAYASVGYVDSGMSGKLDESATADFYSTANPSGFITGVDLSDYATTAYVDSSVSSFVDSAYVESQVSGKEDKLTFGYDDSAISSINGSALAGGGSQVVTSLQYATSESATVASTVTADTAAGYGARDISADYYDYGYGPWTYYDSSTPLIKVHMTAAGNMANFSSYPYYLYMVPYGATNNGNVSYTGELTGALAYGEFSGWMNDFIIAEGTASSIDPYKVGVTFNVTHVPFVGSEIAYWGTVEGYAVVDTDEDNIPVFCVAGGYDGSQLFEVKSNVTAELDFGSLVTVRSVSGINELEIAGGIDSATVSAIASSYAEDVSAAARGAVSTVSSNSADWMKLSSCFAGINGIVTSVGSSTLFTPATASSFMGIGSAIKATTGSGAGFFPDIKYTMGLSGYYQSIKLSADDWQTYVQCMDVVGSVTTVHLSPTAIVTGVSGDISAYSTYGAFTLDYTANSIEPLAFQSDLPTYSYDSNSAISSINGSALAGQGGVTGEYVENSALDSATAHSATGSLTTLATGVSSISGQPLIPTYLANPTYQYGGQSTFVYMPASSIWTTADVATGIFSPLQYATGACLAMDAANFKAYYKGNEWFVSNTAYGYARGEVHQSRGSRVIVEHTGGAGAVLSAKNNQANVTLNSTAYGTAQMAVGSSQAYVQVQRGDSASKYNSAKLDTDYLKFYNGMTTGYLDPEDTASGTSYLPAETEYMYISSIPYWNGKADSSALSSYALSADVSGTVDLVSTQSANWGGSALALSAGPGVKLEKSGNVLVVSTDGAVINEETIAGTWNGNTVYQMLLSGTGQTPGTSNIALPAALISTSIASKWIDPSNSYILYGTTGNRLPSTWVLGEGRYGSLDIIGVNVTMRSTDNGTNNCSAFFNVKYIKAEA